MHKASLEVLLRFACAGQSCGTAVSVASEGWAGGNLTRLPRPVSSWRTTALAWTGPSSRVASSVSHYLPPLGRLPPAGGQVARRLPGRHSSVAASRCAAGLDFLWGAVPREDRHLGALKVVFCPQAQAGHFGRLVGTATPLRGHRRPGPVRASAHLSWVLVGAGVTPAVHSHGPAPLAPVEQLIVRVRTVG